MHSVSTDAPGLIAPDSFKGTHSAVEVAAAIERGLKTAGVRGDLCPAADGGEGTLDALIGGGALREIQVSDPLGREIVAEYGLNGSVAIVETAAASGLSLVAADRRHPRKASTKGTGELIAAAVADGALTIHLGVGGSATTDGGAGAIGAITAAGGLRGAKLIVLCDVDVPFEDAAKVFGLQKGADPEAVEWLTARLHQQARGFQKDPRAMPMTGCAGGLSGGLWAQLDAELVPGARFILDTLDFDVRSRRACAVITGEGRLDDQSWGGKLVSEVARRSTQIGVPCHAIVGSLGLSEPLAISMGLCSVQIASTLAEIESAAAYLASTGFAALSKHQLHAQR